jgi:hypothetical protein
MARTCIQVSVTNKTVILLKVELSNNNNPNTPLKIRFQAR